MFKKIRCKNCNKIIDKSEFICPYCGTQIDNFDDNAKYKSKINFIDNKILQKLLIVIVVILIVVGVNFNIKDKKSTDEVSDNLYEADTVEEKEKLSMDEKIKRKFLKEYDFEKIKISGLEGNAVIEENLDYSLINELLNLCNNERSFYIKYVVDNKSLFSVKNNDIIKIQLRDRKTDKVIASKEIKVKGLKKPKGYVNIQKELAKNNFKIVGYEGLGAVSSCDKKILKGSIVTGVNNGDKVVFNINPNYLEYLRNKNYAVVENSDIYTIRGLKPLNDIKILNKTNLENKAKKVLFSKLKGTPKSVKKEKVYCVNFTYANNEKKDLSMRIQVIYKVNINKEIKYVSLDFSGLIFDINKGVINTDKCKITVNNENKDIKEIINLMEINYMDIIPL